ncbi:hypothetical protein [Actinoplanes xinjiangensis]|nr:hypothetical protein [Actinoplanes xinjiangensis]
MMTSVPGRTTLMVAAAIPFGFILMTFEDTWMNDLADDGTGPVHVTAGLWAVFLLFFPGAMLWRFPRARTAAVAGWALALLPAAGLVAWAHSLMTTAG